MRRETIETTGRGRKTPIETASPAPGRTVRASKAKPQISRTGTAAESEGKITTSIDVIRKWVEVRDGQPAAIKDTAAAEGESVLRINFPGFAREESVRKISWNEWFKEFEESELAFVYQEKTRDGKQSYFFKLMKRPL